MDGLERLDGVEGLPIHDVSDGGVTKRQPNHIANNHYYEESAIDVYPIGFTQGTARDVYPIAFPIRERRDVYPRINESDAYVLSVSIGIQENKSNVDDDPGPSDELYNPAMEDDPKETIMIFLRALDSQSHCLHVGGGCSIPWFQKIIETSLGFPVNSQLLTCNGRLLKCGDSLIDGSTIYLSGKLMGAGPKKKPVGTTPTDDEIEAPLPQPPSPGPPFPQPPSPSRFRDAQPSLDRRFPLPPPRRPIMRSSPVPQLLHGFHCEILSSLILAVLFMVFRGRVVLSKFRVLPFTISKCLLINKVLLITRDMLRYPGFMQH